MTDQKNLLAKMRDMTRQLMQGGPQAATAAIQKALQEATVVPPASTGADSALARQPAAHADTALHDINPPPAGKAAHAPTSATSSHRATTAAPAANSAAGIVSQGAMKGSANGMTDFVPDLLARLGVSADGTVLKKMAGQPAAPSLPEGAQFLSASYTNAAGSRQYKLYVPAAYHGQSLPLVVMLHGCTQDPDDFAAGTQMNAAAELQKCLVLYPQQSKSANNAKCWNWFSSSDQKRDAGEPSIIAGMTREVAASYQVDQRQIYIAGLSAGGAMAAIMGTTYPDLYAGVAVHSGLPYGAATDLPSAMAAMKSGMTRDPAQAQQGPGTRGFKGIPIIVFHGDADHTVNMKNGQQVMASAPPTSGTTSRSREEGQVANGHAYTRTVHKDASGKPVAEHWLIHGFGHAWAGGSALGSYTDARGPDATGEMMRFFYTQARPA